MKLLRWAVGGASAYVIYKYSIGRKAKGEDVFPRPEKAVGEPAPVSKPASENTAPAQPAAEKPANKKPAAKKPAARKAAARKTPARKPAAAKTTVSAAAPGQTAKPKRPARTKPEPQ